MEAAIRVSQNYVADKHGQFLHVDVGGKVLNLCGIAWRSCKDFDSKPLHHYAKVPPFRTFDWHPLQETLIAVGSSGGEATLLNIAEGRQDATSFSVRYGRLCNAVSLSTQNLLATGLDKVRNDFCLNVWDFNQRLPEAGKSGFSKGQTEPLHRLAAGEPISSLRFFQSDPQLLVAGVKGQFVRLYDLREPTSANGLQFQTRCVHNLAIDNRDENYFASCYPQNDPSVCLWDRRMMSRSRSSRIGFGQTEKAQPEATLEVKNAITTPGTIWSLRYSKTRPGRLGVLSSTGQVRVYDFLNEGTTSLSGLNADHQTTTWEEATPQGAYLDRAQDVYRPDHGPSAPGNEMDRVVSFDFLACLSKPGEPEVVVLDVQGKVWLASTSPLPQPSTFTSTSSIYHDQRIVAPVVDGQDRIGQKVEKIRKAAEPRNMQRVAFKQSKSTKSTTSARMSSSANQAWNSDLGFFEKDVPLQDLLTLSSIARLRCEAGYLLNATTNKEIVTDSHWLQSLWAFIERQERISRHNNMTQDNLDLANVGVYGIWMEEVSRKGRLMGTSTRPFDRIILDLARRLNILPGKLCATDYRGHRQLCLHIIGQAWGSEDLERNVKRLIAQNQHTKAAATALFADERKFASLALRHRTASQAHKMLAMALAGFQKRFDPASASTDDDLDSQDEWTETISSLTDDLVDPYARAVLALVKSNDWSSVLQEVGLPLKYRVGIALRHLTDSKLTTYLSQTTKTAIEEGDIEGIILTGTGAKQSMDLMSSYIDRYGDLQTAVLALSSSIPKYLYDDEDVRRRFDAWRKAYRMQMMSWGLKFHRVRFDIASHKLAVDVTGRKVMETPKPQIRLVCTFCNGSIARFERDGERDDGASGDTAAKFVDTAKHPLTSAKAAAIGTVCPKCGRHLPRCGVCDLWLGAPDESYMRWYRNSENGDMSSSAHSAQERPKKDEGRNEITERSYEDKQKQYEEMMARFIVFCIKCTHGFHSGHAKMWFGDKENGEHGHRVCPVPTCNCVCKEVVSN